MESTSCVLVDTVDDFVAAAAADFFPTLFADCFENGLKNFFLFFPNEEINFPPPFSESMLFVCFCSLAVLAAPLLDDTVSFALTGDVCAAFDRRGDLNGLLSGEMNFLGLRADMRNFKKKFRLLFAVLFVVKTSSRC